MFSTSQLLETKYDQYHIYLTNILIYPFIEHMAVYAAQPITLATECVWSTETIFSDMKKRLKHISAGFYFC